MSSHWLLLFSESLNTLGNIFPCSHSMCKDLQEQHYSGVREGLSVMQNAFVLVFSEFEETFLFIEGQDVI